MKETDRCQAQAGSLYPYLISFVAAVGGFLFGYDLCIIAGAQQYLREIFHLTSEQFGFAMASALIGCLAGPFLEVGHAIVLDVRSRL